MKSCATPLPNYLDFKHVTPQEFQEALLQVMERKDHWAWPLFTSGQVSKERLHVHFEQEYATYVRDFPVMVGWAYVQCPVAEVRRELAENLFEEETGGLVAKRPHPELFLEYARGLHMDMSRFENVELLPAAKRYRELIDQFTQTQGWVSAACIATVFIEGTKYERGELDGSAEKRPTARLEDHPLVVHYGLPLESLALTKAHRQVEGSHRQAAWRALLDHAPEPERAGAVRAMNQILDAWKAYRDDVAVACGLCKPE